MDWKKVWKPRTVENVVVQIAIALVFFTGYMIVETIREQRKDKR